MSNSSNKDKIIEVQGELIKNYKNKSKNGKIGKLAANSAMRREKLKLI